MTDPAGRGPDPAALRGRPPYVDVAAAVAAAVTLRIAWFLVSMRNSAIESDAFDNPLIAALFVNPTSINTTAPGGLTFGSLYPTLIGVAEVFLRGWTSPPNTGRLVSAGFGALLVIPIFFLTQSTYGRRPARIAAWAVALHPLLITVSTVVLPTSTFLTLLFTGAWYTLSATVSGRMVTAALAGVLFACAALTRLDGLFIAAVTIVATSVGGDRPLGQTLRRLVVCLGTSGAVLLTYRTFVMSNLASTSTADLFATSRATWWGVFGAIQAFGSPVLMGLAAVGMRHSSASGSTAQTLLLGLFAAGALTSGVSWARGQTVIVLLPILLIWAGSAVARLSDWFATAFAGSRVLSPRSTRVAVTVTLLVAMAAASYRNIQAIPALTETGQLGEKIQLAGRWLTWTDPTAKRVMDTSRNLTFYAGASFVPFPPGDGAAAVAAIESGNVDFIVVRSTGIDDRPYLKDWFEHGIPTRRARLIYSDHASDHQRFVIYRWTAKGEDLGQAAFAENAPDVPKPAISGATFPAGPLKVSSTNPRYFADRLGRVVYLTGFHTWSSLQDADRFDPPRRFDFDRYLWYLQAYHHNFIRLWTTEQANWVPWRPYDFRIEPAAYLRSGQGLALDGKPKFDVSRFNEAYFSRLRERVKVAGEHGMYVSVMLFNGWSVEKKGERWEDPWRGHPLHRDNNINGLDGDPHRTGTGSDVHALRDRRIRDAQEAYVTKVVDAVNDLDNVLFEICNECQDGSVEWQYHMIRFVHQLESSRSKQHPVGMTAIYPPAATSISSRVLRIGSRRTSRLAMRPTHRLRTGRK